MAGYRAYLETVNTEPVQAAARVPHGPRIDGVQELKAHLLKDRQKDIVENVIRRLLTYGLGRELTYRDRFAVERLLEQANHNNHRLRDLIVSICQSETFRGATPKRDEP